MSASADEGFRNVQSAWRPTLGKFGITVNCITSEPSLTELILRNFTEEARQKFADRTALGR